MSRFTRRQLVEVEWDDACARGGWLPMDKHIEQHALRTRSVGYRLRNDREAIVLLQSQNIHDEYSDAIVIPRGMVRKVRVLRR